jgi:hypothetical protein
VIDALAGGARGRETEYFTKYPKKIRVVCFLKLFESSRSTTAKFHDAP